MNPPKIVVPDDCPALLVTSPAFQTLQRETTGIKYFNTLPGSVERLIERIRDAAVVINVRSSSIFSSEVFQSCPGLRLVSVWGTGTDNVDLAAAAKHAVTVTNTPAVSAGSVAEHALTLMLAVARRIPMQDAAVRRGNWLRGQGTELRGKTLGIVGLGAIGRRFAELGQGIGMRVIAWTPHSARRGPSSTSWSRPAATSAATRMEGTAARPAPASTASRRLSPSVQERGPRVDTSNVLPPWWNRHSAARGTSA